VRLHAGSKPTRATSPLVAVALGVLAACSPTIQPNAALLTTDELCPELEATNARVPPLADAGLGDADSSRPASSASQWSGIATPLTLLVDPVVGLTYELTETPITNCSPTGAIDDNETLETEVAAGHVPTTTFQVWEQYAGGRLATAGAMQLLCSSNTSLAGELIEEGLFLQDWGFQTEVTDPTLGANYLGTFCYDWMTDQCVHYLGPNTWHSGQLFVEGAAWAMLAVREACARTSDARCTTAGTFTPPCKGAGSAPSGNWVGHIANDVPLLETALQWFEHGTPNGTNFQSLLRADNKPDTHRSWINAAIFAEGAALVEAGDPDLAAAYAAVATSYVSEALAAQWSDGTNPEGTTTEILYAQWPSPGFALTPGTEGNGFDGSYQGVGLMYASHFVAACSRSNACRAAASDVIGQVGIMSAHAVERELSHVLPNGTVFCAPSQVLAAADLDSRACSRIPYEHKTVDYRSVASALGFWVHLWSGAPQLVASVAASEIASTTSAVNAEGVQFLALYAEGDVPRGVEMSETLQFDSGTGALVFSSPLPGGTQTTLPLGTGGTMQLDPGLTGTRSVTGASIADVPVGVALNVRAHTALDDVATTDTETVHVSVGPATHALLCTDAACTSPGASAVDLALVEGEGTLFVVDSVAETVTITAQASSATGWAQPDDPTVVQFVSP
jgi:hypothetical protein